MLAELYHSQLSGATSAMPQQRMNGITDSMPPHERVYILIDEMRKATRTSSATRMRDLSQDSTIIQDFKQILRIVSATGHPALDHVARQVVDKITAIFTSQPPQNYLEAESLAYLLIKMCEPSESIMRDVMRWITNNEGGISMGRNDPSSGKPDPSAPAMTVGNIYYGSKGYLVMDGGYHSFKTYMGPGQEPGPGATALVQ